MRVGRKRLVLLSQAVARRDLAEPVEVDDVERRDVVRVAFEVVLPVAVGVRVSAGNVREEEASETHPVFQNRKPSISARSSPIGAKAYGAPCKSRSTSSFKSARTILRRSTRVSAAFRLAGKNGGLVRVNEDDAVELKREKNVKEEDLVAATTNRVSGSARLEVGWTTHPQIVRCFSFCARSQCGHLYVTSS